MWSGVGLLVAEMGMVGVVGELLMMIAVGWRLVRVVVLVVVVVVRLEVSEEVVLEVLPVWRQVGLLLWKLLSSMRMLLELLL